MILAAAMILPLVGCGIKIPDLPDIGDITDIIESNLPNIPIGDDSKSDVSTEPISDIRAAFIALVDRCNGFEMKLDNSDGSTRTIGGKNNVYWMIDQFPTHTAMYYVEGSDDNALTTVFQTENGETKAMEAPTFSVLDFIASAAYLGEIYKSMATASTTKYNGYDCAVYSVFFGAMLVNIATEYGVTVRFCIENDDSSNFELNYIHTGSEVNKVEKPEATYVDPENPDGPTDPGDPDAPVNPDYDNPSYWDELYGVNICPFTVTINGVGKTFYFRGGGSFIRWLRSENNTEGWYYYNDLIITKDGKWAIGPGNDPDFNDDFSSFCRYEFKPYDGPTLTAEEQAQPQKGAVYALHSYTPLRLWDWTNMILDGEGTPELDTEFTLDALYCEFADQEWIHVYVDERGDSEELMEKAELLYFLHRDIAEYGGYITDELRDTALGCANYTYREDPEAEDRDNPIFSFYIPNEYNDEAFYGDVDLLFVFDNVIAYYVVVTATDRPVNAQAD